MAAGMGVVYKSALSAGLAVIFVTFLLTVSGIDDAAPGSISKVKVLTDAHWKDLLEDEWLVKFYAPWCPACQSLAPTWEKLAERSAPLKISIADVDVTENAALSGKFFVTSLPTIYHVKDGVFRQYRGSRSEQDFARFIADKKWMDVDPVPWYQSPSSYHMAVVGLFFEISVSIRNLHNSVTTDYGIPVWGSYTLMAIATILIGLAIGLFFVCLCDALSGGRSEPRKTYNNQQHNAAGDINDDESDVLDDRDDAVRQPKSGETVPPRSGHDTTTDSLASAAGGDGEVSGTSRRRKI